MSQVERWSASGMYQGSVMPAASRARVLKGGGNRLRSTCSSTSPWNVVIGSLPCASHRCVNHCGGRETISANRKARTKNGNHTFTPSCTCRTSSLQILSMILALIASLAP